MVLPEESSEEMAKPENGWRLLEPWGLTPDNAELERSAVYRFQARWAEQWRVGRCMLAGDAAHLMPPFAGAGMCSGLRDAVGLGWRLNAVLDGTLDDAVLDSYVSERLHHAKYFVDFSQQLGDIICITDPVKAAERDSAMKASLAERDNKPIKVDLVQLGEGVWCADTPAAGELSTQGIVDANGKRDRFDQAVGQAWMVIAYNTDPSAVLSEQQTSQLQRLGGQTVMIGEPGSECDVVDIEGTYAQWMGDMNVNYFILRPDFYVAATASSEDELGQRFDEVMEKLHLSVI